MRRITPCSSYVHEAALILDNKRIPLIPKVVYLNINGTSRTFLPSIQLWPLPKGGRGHEWPGDACHQSQLRLRPALVHQFWQTLAIQPLDVPWPAWQIRHL